MIKIKINNTFFSAPLIPREGAPITERTDTETLKETMKGEPDKSPSTLTPQEAAQGGISPDSKPEETLIPVEDGADGK